VPKKSVWQGHDHRLLEALGWKVRTAFSGPASIGVLILCRVVEETPQFFSGCMNVCFHLSKSRQCNLYSHLVPWFSVCQSKFINCSHVYNKIQQLAWRYLDSLQVASLSVVM
jgi:hypothetical protein